MMPVGSSGLCGGAVVGGDVVTGQEPDHLARLLSRRKESLLAAVRD